MRAGSMPTTSQVNPEEAKEFFLELLKTTNEILHIAFSSALSGTYNSVRIAAEEIMEEREDCKIVVIDAMCASLGLGLLVHKAVMLREAGKNFDEVCRWAQENACKVCHVFTVDDLNHLHRGGRVSKMTAVVGTIAGIKPLLKVDDEGKLVAHDKTRGRKKSLVALVDYMELHIGNRVNENDIIFISHGDALEDVTFVTELIDERFGKKEYLIHTIGPTIGAHSGPGTIALFFLGEKR
ncbi:MAG: DegV family protein, partial [Eubacteriales bacterium]